ncbi:MAG: SIS domain-containing protein [Oligoflexales bacterium]|nr:SIS domain-containing protein [Oligoflexales bacterium]
MISHIRSALEESRRALDAFLKDELSLARLEKAGRLLASTFKNQGRAFACGNGGSMCDAMHFAEELSGRFRKDRPALPALAISDPAHISCTGNDFGYEHVFSRFLEAHIREGDVLLAISTSGKSTNILKAAELAKSKGASVISLTGHPASPLSLFADIDLCTYSSSRYSDRIQELHIKCIHILIELVERQLFSPEY